MDRRGALVPAMILILIGVFFLLVNLNVLPSLSITQLWPGIVVLVGLMFWLGFIFSREHDPGLALWARSLRSSARSSSFSHSDCLLSVLARSIGVTWDACGRCFH